MKKGKTAGIDGTQISGNMEAQQTPLTFCLLLTEKRGKPSQIIAESPNPQTLGGFLPGSG